MLGAGISKFAFAESFVSEFFGGRQDEKTLQLLGMEVQG